MTRLVSVALVFVLVVAACGDDDAGDGGSAPLTATTSTQAPTTTSATTSTTAPQNDVVVADGDFVEVHYRCTLDDGTEFDSSAGRAPHAANRRSHSIESRGFWRRRRSASSSIEA